MDSRTQRVYRKCLRAYDDFLPLSDDSHELRASLFSFDLLNLESEFERFDVSDSSAPQQPLQDTRGRIQFLMDGRDQGMNDRGHWFHSSYQQATKREQINQSQRFAKDNGVNRYDAHRSYNYDFHERSSGGVMGSQNSSFNINLGDNHFSSSNLFFDHNLWGYTYGYMFGIPTNHDTILSLAKDCKESQLLQYVIVKGSKETID